ncbi:mitochondrial DnaJ homolog 2 [Diutina catenulata]
MVFPILAGLSIAVSALTVKSTIAALRKYRYLTPQMIAQLNNLKLVDPMASATHVDRTDPRYQQYQYIRAHFANEGFKDRLTEDEALAILGISGEDIMHISKKMVHDRWRRLMMLNHPDKHGSKYLSQKLNEAKEVLDKSVMTRER